MKDLVTERLKLKDLYPERAEALAKEHDIDIEDLELVRKGIVAEKAEVDKDNRAVTSYINTAIKDRDNEIIEPEGAILTHYRKNPVVPYGHDYRGLPVGKNIWIKKDKKGLLAKTVFLKHQFADEVYQLYSEDVAGTGPAMKGWSIGFIPLKWEEPEVKDSKPKEGEQDTRLRRRYKEWELMEYSAVMIPSNREALTEMVAKGLITSEKLKKDIIEVELEEMDNKYDDFNYGLDENVMLGFTKELITKPEETDDFIRLPAKGEEGKHKGHKIRWITVSEKQGIKGLYCIDCKKIITYIFLKSKGWTMAKAKKWMADHGKTVMDTVESGRLSEAAFEEIQDLLNLDDENRQFIEAAGIDKAKYNCECINPKCGHKLTSEKHCKDLKCPKCGGTMRRVGRPGPGQESTNNLGSFDFLKDEREDIYSVDNGEVVELEDNSITEEAQKARNSLKDIKLLSEEELKDYFSLFKEMFPEFVEELGQTEEERIMTVSDVVFELEVEDERKVDIQDVKGDGSGDKVDIDKKALTLEIASIIKNRIGDMVQSAINRARGKVE